MIDPIACTLARLVERQATAHQIFTDTSCSTAYTTLLDSLPDGYTIDPTTPGMWQLTMPARRGGWAYIEGPSIARLHRAAWAIHDATGDLEDTLRRAGAQLMGGEFL